VYAIGKGAIIAWRQSDKFYWYYFPGFFSWKILPLVDFIWLPPGNDFTSPEGV